MDERTAMTPKARAVLDAASRLFYERGIHAVGVDAVAAAAGVTKKTLYDRFGSKDRLVVAYLEERDRRWDAALRERLLATAPEPRARVGAVFAAAAEWAREQGGRGCAMINAHAEISDPDHPAYAVILGQKRRMLELFTTLATEAGAADPQEVGEHLMLLHEGAVTTAGMRAVPDPFARAAAVAAQLVP